MSRLRGWVRQTGPQQRTSSNKQHDGQTDTAGCTFISQTSMSASPSCMNISAVREPIMSVSKIRCSVSAGTYCKNSWTLKVSICLKQTGVYSMSSERCARPFRTVGAKIWESESVERLFVKVDDMTAPPKCVFTSSMLVEGTWTKLNYKIKPFFVSYWCKTECSFLLCYLMSAKTYSRLEQCFYGQGLVTVDQFYSFGFKWLWHCKSVLEGVNILSIL